MLCVYVALECVCVLLCVYIQYVGKRALGKMSKINASSFHVGLVCVCVCVCVSVCVCSM